MSGMSISGGISTAAAALLASRSDEPLALDLLLRVRVVRSRDISVFSLGLGRRAPLGLSKSVSRRVCGSPARLPFAPFCSPNCG
jgi:hypothetical protein